MDIKAEIRRLELVIAKNPGDYETLFRLGVLFEQENDYRKALACFQDIFLSMPSLCKARFELGIVHSVMGRYEEAVKEWMRVLDDDNDYQFASMTMQHRGTFIEAIRKWEEFERNERMTAYSQFTLAFAYYALRQLDRAVTHASRAVSIDARLEGAHFILGLACEENGAFDDAAKAYRAELSLTPESANINYHLGLVLQQSGMTQKAASALQKAVQVKPRYKKALLRLGIISSLGELWKEAEEYLRRALDCDPGFAEAHLALGNVWFSTYRMDDAAAEYRQAISCKPSLKEASIKLGELRKIQGKMDEALSHFELALALDPHDADVSYQTGYIYFQQKRYKDAAGAMKKTILARPQDPTAHYILGEALTAQGIYGQAIEAYRKALSFNRQDTKIRRSLGKAHFRNGDFESAAREFGKALEIVPGDQLCHHLLALSHLLSGRYREAYEVYENLVDPAGAYRHLCLGATCLWMNDHDRAVYEFEKISPLLNDSENDPSLWGTLALFAATGIEMASRHRELGSLKRQLRDASDEAVKALLQALEIKDSNARIHSIRVALIARELAVHIHSLDPDLVSEELVEEIEVAAVLHDIGLIGVPDYILRRKGEVLETEKAAMEKHPLLGVKILVNIELPWDLIPLVRSHHERWDGTGYPEKLQGAAIPLGAVIIGIADHYEHLVSGTGGKKGASPAEALKLLMQEKDRGYAGMILEFFSDIAPGLEKLLAELHIKS